MTRCQSIDIKRGCGSTRIISCIHRSPFVSASRTHDAEYDAEIVRKSLFGTAQATRFITLEDITTDSLIKLNHRSLVIRAGAAHKTPSVRVNEKEVHVEKALSLRLMMAYSLAVKPPGT